MILPFCVKIPALHATPQALVFAVISVDAAVYASTLQVENLLQQ